jgi:PAS domain-containing protein
LCQTQVRVPQDCPLHEREDRGSAPAGDLPIVGLPIKEETSGLDRRNGFTSGGHARAYGLREGVAYERTRTSRSRTLCSRRQPGTGDRGEGDAARAHPVPGRQPPDVELVRLSSSGPASNSHFGTSKRLKPTRERSGSSSRACPPPITAFPHSTVDGALDAQEARPRRSVHHRLGTLGEERAIELLKSGSRITSSTGLASPAVRRALSEATERLERKRAEAAPARARNATRSPSEAPETDCGIGTEDGELYLSPRWKEMLGYAEHEVGATPTSGSDGCIRARSTDSMRGSGGISTARLHTSVRAPPPSPGWVACLGARPWTRGPRRGRRSQSDRGSLTDISERKRAEEGLLRNAFFDRLTRFPVERCSRTAWSAPSRSPAGGRTTSSPFCSWTSTVSNWSTTAWAMPQATRCSRRSP